MDTKSNWFSISAIDYYYWHSGTYYCYYWGYQYHHLYWP